MSIRGGQRLKDCHMEVETWNPHGFGLDMSVHELLHAMTGSC